MLRAVQGKRCHVSVRVDFVQSQAHSREGAELHSDVCRGRLWCLKGTVREAEELRGSVESERAKLRRGGPYK